MNEKNNVNVLKERTLLDIIKCYIIKSFSDGLWINGNNVWDSQGQER